MIHGLERAVEIIKMEKEVAIQLNPIMAIGMEQVIMLIEDEIDQLKNTK